MTPFEIELSELGQKSQHQTKHTTLSLNKAGFHLSDFLLLNTLGIYSQMLKVNTKSNLYLQTPTTHLIQQAGKADAIIIIFYLQMGKLSHKMPIFV